MTGSVRRGARSVRHVTPSRRPGAANSGARTTAFGRRIVTVPTRTTVSAGQRPSSGRAPSHP
ncbi:hypothetical protein ACFCZ2_00495 [Streptomyces sp. NPDC056202]|uniref:hypothetical protein n=1 Tax=Streptomyces sp. NPDC056202 TaxID=3345745 RepID=UPI0035D697B1